MANHWDSEYAIWRDLSVAQGREVPAQIDNTVAKDEKPPRLLLTEETEEEFFGNYVGAGDDNCAPDLKLIQMMLQEVSKPSAEESSETVIEITKTPTRQKNLAIASILKMHHDNSSEVLQNGHFRPSTSQPEVVPVWDTAMMFKKKTKSVENSRSSENSPQSVKSDSDLEQPRTFVPSSRAAEYYTKYREQNRARELANEDIWSKAQREMEELDQKRKMEAVSPCSSSSSEKPAQGIDLVRLSAHRHSFTDTKDCVVCKVLCSRTETTPTDTVPI